MAVPGIEIAISTILEVSRGPAGRRLNRSETIQRTLEQLNFTIDPPPNDFDAIYVRSLVEYGANRPEPVLNMWRNDFIRGAFRNSFYSGDPHFLESEVETIMSLQQERQVLGELEYDFRQEIDDFANQFNQIVDRIRTPHQAKQDLQIAAIAEYDELQANKLDEILEEVRKRPLADPDHTRPILGASTPPPTFVPQNYVERSDHLSNLRQALGYDSDISPSEILSSAVVLRGIGGSGKTTLAQGFLLSTDFKARFPGGAHWIYLAGADLSTSDRLNKIMIEMGVDPQAFDTLELKVQAMRTQLALLPTLLVLDGASEAEQCRPFIEALTTGSCALITTRNVQMAARLEVGNELFVAGFTPEEARSAIAGRIGSDYDDAMWESQIEPVVLSLGFHPLAISLASSQVLLGEVTWGMLMELIQSGALPKAIDFEDPSKASESLELTFLDSFDRLPDEIRMRFRWLSVMAMGKSFILPDAARHLSGRPEHQEKLKQITSEDPAKPNLGWISEQSELAADTLSVLVKRGLLERAQLPNGLDIYRFHPVIQSIAVADLRDAGELDAALNHHTMINYMLTLGEVDSPAPFHAYLSSRYQILEVLERAWSRLAGGSAIPLPTTEVAEATIVVIANTMSRQWALMGENDERAKWLARAMDIAQSHEQDDTAHYLREELAHAQLQLGNHEQAQNLYDVAGTFARASEDPHQITLARINSALPAILQGQSEQVIPELESALEDARANEDHELIGMALGTLAQALWHIHRIDEAIQYQEEAISLAISTGDQNAYGKRVGNLGAQYTERAMQYLRKGVSLLHTSRLTSMNTGNVQSQANHTLNIANAYSALGYREIAQLCIEQAIELLDQMNSPSLGRAQELEERIHHGKPLAAEPLEYPELLQHAEAALRGDQISEIRLRNFIRVILDNEEKFPARSPTVRSIQLMLDGERDPETIINGLDDPESINIRLLILSLERPGMNDFLTGIIVTITLALTGDEARIRQLPHLISFLDTANPLPAERVGLIRMVRGVQVGDTDPQLLTSEIESPFLRDTLRIMIAAGPPTTDIADPDTPPEIQLD